MTCKTTIIFDLDGTLIHSAPDLQAALNTALAPLGRGPLDLDTVISFVGNGVERLVERGLTATGGTGTVLQSRTLAAFLKAYETNGVALTTVYEGVPDQLQRLKDAGKALGICTNKPQGPAQHVCDALELTPLFDAITGARPDQPKKPDPAALLRTMTALGAAREQTLYVGDSLVDCETARAAEVDFWLYSGGYLKGDIPPGKCSKVFDDWTDPALFLS